MLIQQPEHKKENRFGKAVPLRGIYIEY